MNELSPLVSIIVITYNSSKYILETLNSIYNQSYNNLELIISDDCSKDNTIEIVNKWLDTYKYKFSKTLVITSEENTGVSKNWNRGVFSSTAEYCKLIAGDDILEANCISTYIDYIKYHPEAIVIFSKVTFFGDKKILKKFISPFKYDFFSWTIDKQLHHLIYDRNCIPAPTLFLNLNKIKTLNIKADERIPMMEDYPLWINMLSKGIRFHFIDEFLVKYRVNNNGLSTGKNFSLMKDSVRLFELFYRIPYKYSQNTDDAVFFIFKTEKDIYEKILNSKDFKLGRFILKPFRFIKSFIVKIKDSFV